MQTVLPRRRSPIQFGLRSLLLLMFGAAIVAWLFTVLEPDLLLFFLVMVYPVVAVSASILGVIYLRGGYRAFWLGFGIPLLQVIVLGMFFEFFERRFMREWEAMILLPILLMATPVGTGFLGVYFHRLGQRQDAEQTAAAAANDSGNGQSPL